MPPTAPLPPWSRVRAVADRQRQVLWAFLAGLLVLPAGALLAAAGMGDAEAATSAVLLLAMATRVAMAVTVYRMTAAWGSRVAVVWAVGAFVPNIVGLLVLLAANGRATRFLKEAGVKVGFFGVKLGETPPPGSRHADVSDVFS